MEGIPPPSTNNEENRPPNESGFFFNIFRRAPLFGPIFALRDLTSGRNSEREEGGFFGRTSSIRIISSTYSNSERNLEYAPQPNINPDEIREAIAQNLLEVQNIIDYGNYNEFTEDKVEEKDIRKNINDNDVEMKNEKEAFNMNCFDLNKRVLVKGQWVDVKDTVEQWLDAQVIEVSDDNTMVKIHYNHWSTRWDEWIKTNSPRIMPFRYHTRQSILSNYHSPFPNKKPDMGITLLSFENLNKNSCVNPSYLTQPRIRTSTVISNTINNNTNNSRQESSSNNNNDSNTNNNEQNQNNNRNMARRTGRGRYADPPVPIPSPKHLEPDPENHIIKNLGEDGFLGVFKEFNQINKVINGLSSELINEYNYNTEILTPKKLSEIQNYNNNNNNNNPKNFITNNDTKNTSYNNTNNINYKIINTNNVNYKLYNSTNTSVNNNNNNNYQSNYNNKNKNNNVRNISNITNKSNNTTNYNNTSYQKNIVHTDNRNYKNSKSNINILSRTKPQYNNYNFVQMKRNDNSKSYSKIIFDNNIYGNSNTIDFSTNNNNNIIVSSKNDYNNYTNKSNNLNPIKYINTNYYTINSNNNNDKIGDTQVYKYQNKDSDFERGASYNNYQIARSTKNIKSPYNKYQYNIVEVIPVKLCNNYSSKTRFFSYPKPQYVKPYFKQGVIITDIKCENSNNNNNINKSNIDYPRVYSNQNLPNRQTIESFRDFDNLEDYDAQDRYKNDMKNDDTYKNVELKYSDISSEKNRTQKYVRPFTNVEKKNNKNEIKGYILRRNQNNHINNHKLIKSYATGANYKKY